MLRFESQGGLKSSTRADDSERGSSVAHLSEVGDESAKPYREADGPPTRSESSPQA